mgnify:FL=1
MEDALPSGELLAYLSLVVALSAYLSAVRLWLISRAADANRRIDAAAKAGESTDDDERRKRTHKRSAALLAWADAPLIFAGVLAFLHGFWPLTLAMWLHCPDPPAWLLPTSAGGFTFAAVVLIALHFPLWARSVRANRGTA